MRSLLSLTVILSTLAACKGAPSEVDSGAADLDGDGSLADVDCDDDNPAVHPGADELCDGLDNDCDGTVDVGALDASTWLMDSDGDGYGDDDSAFLACEGAPGAVALGGDCDDDDPRFAPGAVEDDCTDPNDYNCDGSVGYTDADGDGAAACEDCDDSDSGAHPGGVETCDGVDNDCDGDVDGPDSVDAMEWYNDADGDGYGDPNVALRGCAPPTGTVDDNRDCDDSDAALNPETSWFRDLDQDGHGDPAVAQQRCEPSDSYVRADTDCDDLNPAVNPDQPEVCNGVDDDCDSAVDDADASVTDQGTWYADGDGDGYGDPASALDACELSSGYVADASDCDDGDAAVHPAADEVCDSLDNDCDGTTDEDDALDASTWYADNDGDGFGDAATSFDACSAPTAYLSDDSDCDDADATVYPGSHEIEVPGDGVDTDCDGNDDCDDLNCDGYPDIVVPNYYDGSSYTPDSFVYYGSASGHSSADRDELPTDNARRAQVYDFNNDGYPDILFIAYYNGSSYLTESTIYYGSATGFSSSNVDTLEAYGPLDACVGDLDNDGLLDVVLAEYYNGDTTLAFYHSGYMTNSVVFYNSTSGFSASNTTTLNQWGARDCAIEDLDNDGYEDIVFASHLTHPWRSATSSAIYWGGASGFTEANRTSLVGDRRGRVYVEDIDADGYADILLTTYYDGDYAADSEIYWGSASGYFNSNITTLASAGAWDAAIADMDNDGRLDIALGSYYTGSDYSGQSTYVYYQSSSGFSSSDMDVLTSAGTRQLSAADLDGDGYTDLVASNLLEASGVYETDSFVFWGDSAGFSDSNRTDLPVYGSFSHSIGDLDGDGLPELLFSGHRDNSLAYSVDTLIYGASSSGYSSADVTALEGHGLVGAPLIVGAP